MYVVTIILSRSRGLYDYDKGVNGLFISSFNLFSRDDKIEEEIEKKKKK